MRTLTATLLTLTLIHRSRDHVCTRKCHNNYRFSGLDGGPLPKIKFRDKELEGLVDSLVYKLNEASAKLADFRRTTDAARSYYIEPEYRA